MTLFLYYMLEPIMLSQWSDILICVVAFCQSSVCNVCHSLLVCMKMADLKIYSFNVCGIRDNIKRGVVLPHLFGSWSSFTMDIEQKWELKWNRDCVYFSHGTNDSCGVAIFISPELDINTSSICNYSVLLLVYTWSPYPWSPVEITPVLTTFYGYYPRVHYVYVLWHIMISQWLMTLLRMPHYGTTMGNDVARDIHE